MDKLMELAGRVEAATGVSREAALSSAFEALYPEPPSDYQPKRDPSFSPIWSAWARVRASVLNAGQFDSFESGALMLIERAWHVRNISQDSCGRGWAVVLRNADRDRDQLAEGHSMDLGMAITAAALRSRATAPPLPAPMKGK